MTEEFRPYAGNLSKAHTELNNTREKLKTVKMYEGLKLQVAIAFVHCWIEIAAQIRDYVKHVTSDK